LSVEASARDRSLVRGSPTECLCVTECDQVQHFLHQQRIRRNVRLKEKIVAKYFSLLGVLYNVMRINPDMLYFRNALQVLL